MGKVTKIAWTDRTFNPWWGCTAVSPGCAHCYAETLAKRTGHGWGPAAQRRFFGDKHWNEPARWNEEALEAGTRLRVFCASMADVFEDNLELVEHRDRLWDLIEHTPNLDWLILTKRPENVNNMIRWGWGKRTEGWNGWPPNVWLGTSVENQEQADKRIPKLLLTDARVKFLSCEPLLGPVDFVPHLWRPVLNGAPADLERAPGIDWVIVGGESGAAARPMDPAWAHSLKAQCLGAGVKFFMKQLGGARDKVEDLERMPAELRLREWPS